MVEPRTVTLRELWRPRMVKAAFWAIAGVAAYDSFGSQFDLPNIRAVAGMSGNLLPGWGWLLMLQAVFVYSLFEYVRQRGQEGSKGTLDLGHLEARFETVDAAASETVQEIERLKLIFAHSMEHLTDAQEKITSCSIEIKRLAGDLDGFKESAQATFAETSHDFGAIVANQSLSADAIAQSFYSVRRSLSAIFHRERLRELANTIQDGADRLSSQLGGSAVLDANAWVAWVKNEEEWRSLVYTWCMWAAPYVPNLLDAINRPDARLYDAEWTVLDGQFPSAAAVHKFKSFRIAAIHFGEARTVVQEHVHRVAFEAGSGIPIP